MKPSFFLKRGDTSRPLRHELPAGTNLVGASVRFYYRKRFEDELRIDTSAKIVSRNPPVVSYDWHAGGNEETGIFYGEFEVFFADDERASYPPDSHILVKVTEDLD